MKKIWGLCKAQLKLVYLFMFGSKSQNKLIYKTYILKILIFNIAIVYEKIYQIVKVEIRNIL